MEEFEFDKTRKAIGVDKLEEEEKKKLLKEFQEKGGKILKEKAVKKNLNVPYKSNQENKETFVREVKLPSQIYREQRQKEIEKIAQERAKKDHILKKASSPFAIFSLRLELWFKGIIFFNKELLKPSFISFLNLEFKKSIMECNILTTELLSDAKFLEVFKKSYTPLYLELLKRVYLLYDRKLLTELTSYSSEPDAVVVPDVLRLPLFSFLRKLYTLYPFKELTLKLLTDCIDIQQSIQKKQEALYKNKKKKIEESWKILMDKALPKFFLLAQFIERKKLEPFTTLFEKMINITDNDKIDPNKLKDFKDVKLEEIIKILFPDTEKKEEKQGSENLEQKNTEKENQNNESEIKRQEIHNKIYNFGLRFIHLYPLNKLKEIYDPKDEFKNLNFNDKLFISYLLLNFFDDQFGFIFLTNKIQINTFIKDGVKVNLKEEMSILYENFRKIYESFRKYYNDYIEYLNIKNDTYVDRNSLDYQKKLDYYEQRRNKSAKETHKIMLNYIKKCEQFLLFLFKDLREKNLYVANPEDILELEFGESKNKLMHKRKVKEAIRDAYATAYTISYKMEKGELAVGEIELTEEEFHLHYGDIV